MIFHVHVDGAALQAAACAGYRIVPLGGIQRENSDAFPCKCLFYTTGVSATGGPPYVHLVNMIDPAEAHAYKEAFMSVKDAIAERNGELAAQHLSQAAYEAWLRDEWLGGHVLNLVNTWGASLVPHDVRDAVNQVQTALGVATTVWAE